VSSPVCQEDHPAGGGVWRCLLQALCHPDFDPKIAKLNDNDVVDQKWAKKQFARFLNTVKKAYDRKADKLGGKHPEFSYIWVAEIQEKNTKNIHFHILMNEPFIPAQWLVKIWGQASNSVNVKKLNNQDHAVSYMLKYMKKGHCPIEGKRYGMSQNLLKALRPQKLRFAGTDKQEAFNRVRRVFRGQIQDNGGRDLMYGLFIPPPKRKRYWRDVNGRVHEKAGVSRHLGEKFLRQVKLAMAIVDHHRRCEQEIDDAADVPF
jgi:hypothetical protein